jgi:NAD(P)-dependent dehydrogenase (short-subunit alcohol dehydrogenase family)
MMLLSLKVIVALIAIFVGLLMSPIPKQIGFYRWLFLKVNPASVGILPCSLPTLNDWGFTFKELYDNDRYHEKKNSLWGQTALITGANSGIGYEISLALARLGVSVTMACRNKDKCKAAALQIRNDDVVLNRSKERNNNLVGPGMAIKTMTVDTSSLKSVRKFCKQFLIETDDDDDVPMPLDMLFLNAGIGHQPPSDDGTLALSEDGIENLFATNVVGHHLMYKLLEPSLKRNDSLRKTPPRIVLTSSSASYYHLSYPYKIATDIQTLNSAVSVDDPNALYAQSKLAQIYWTKELNDRLIMKEEREQEENKNNSNDPNSIMYVNAVHPGAVNTYIWDKVEMEKIPDLSNKLVLTVSKYSLNFLRNFMWTSEEGALTLLYLGTNVHDLQTKNIRGKYYHPQSIEMKNHQYAPDNNKETKLLQEKLWIFLDELVADFL